MVRYIEVKDATITSNIDGIKVDVNIRSSKGTNKGINVSIDGNLYLAVDIEDGKISIASMGAPEIEDVRCSYCGCILSTDSNGNPIPHDHTDDSPESLERPRADY